MSYTQYLSRPVLDVRSYNEFLRGHLPGAIHIPLEQLLHRHNELNYEIGYCIICEHGVRGLLACDFLQSKGYDVVNFPGGMSFLEEQIKQQKISINLNS
ncbi:hypothetical protein COV81_05145 [Candidatus Peregrinibacteria bacterium CG11_big_fil_rev_8_21_14_0_20_41_10]|nr:MAG: hypothetical protein COV81_05145 [Candidatus Peregrinibacteria bacterium CG11_big_fil_rev_8_21_14_0_20_41_10]PIZ76904.1 MAG: hypothetical protein COY06_01140 [Candidatus Peregrinibacteria bacterium CG_4_10_14_0_2_um_filter_41_8]PJC37810.1 MAG: hypothetical protein CO045_03520 [Candidatus Peregrinibacteria bacterium CG_4_9_14_0_2_um_filter_41_14]